MNSVPPEFIEMLRDAGLASADEAPAGEELTGGVASDIWRVDLRRRTVCVKRARAKLKVEQDWRVPVERNAFEAAWLETANRIVPGAAPRILCHDARAGMFAMDFLDPANFKPWKTELLAGRPDPDFAADVGRKLAQIHSATAGDRETAERFPTDDIFHAIRLAPYLEAAASAHPGLEVPLKELVRVTGGMHRMLVHGDVSPKNIFAGPDGPVFLDAECAWYGDPAFDIAFCLNHLLLKCLAVPAAISGFMDCFEALESAYLKTVTGEPAAAIESRAARLLPGLFLARVDGKSPVEYITDETQKDRVRRTAAGLLARPVDRLGDVRRAWAEELNRGTAARPGR